MLGTARLALGSLALFAVAGCGASHVKEAPPTGGAGGESAHDASAGADFGVTLADAPAAADSAATAPTCAAEAFKAMPVQLDLVLLIDQSPSMLFKIGARSKWELAREALVRFLMDPRSAGLGVGIQAFPIPSRAAACATDEECGYLFACKNGKCTGYPFNPFPSCAPDDYTRLVLPIASLPAAQDTLVRFVERMAPNPNQGVSAVGPAAQGVFRALRTRLAGDPSRHIALVLVTDGVPSGCFFGWLEPEDIARGLGEQYKMAPSIPTYVIGLFSADKQEDAGGPEALRTYAEAGGSGAPFIVKPPDDVTGKFVEALDQIRASTLPCEYTIPPAKMGALDYDKVNLHVQSGGAGEDIPYVAKAAACDATGGGWYYDADPTAGGTPTKIVACPATCRRFKTQQAGEVSLTFGCKTRVIN